MFLLEQFFNIFCSCNSPIVFWKIYFLPRDKSQHNLTSILENIKKWSKHSKFNEVKTEASTAEMRVIWKRSTSSIIIASLKFKRKINIIKLN